MSPICGVILQSHYSLCMSDLHCKHCWSHYLTHIKGCLLKGSENISRDLQPSSLCFRNMLIWSNLSPPLLCCVSCVKLANTLMTHFQNFSNCKDKPLQPSQPQVIKPNPLLMIKFFICFWKSYNQGNQHLSHCLSDLYKWRVRLCWLNFGERKKPRPK